MDEPAHSTPAPPIIGLAGGIGAGKTTVANMLERMGCTVARSDEGGRAALRDPEIRDTLVRWWGRAILDDTGEVDRRRVAEIVFVDKSERARLEQLTHPWIEARRRAAFAAAGPETVAFVIDAPLLYEAGVDDECDAVIFVQTTGTERDRRLRSTRGWAVSERRRREDSQLPLDVKESRADYVLRNDGDLEALEAQVRSVLNTIVESRHT